MHKVVDSPRIKSEVKDRKFVEALARGLDVLRAFGQRSGVLGNQEIAAITNLPKPTVSRLTYTLTQLGYLNYSKRLEKYELGSSVLALGYAYTSNLRIRQIAQPYMVEMAKEHSVSIGLATREGLSMIFVEYCRGEGVQSLRVDVGSRLPMATSAIGRAFLAGLDEQERSVYIPLLKNLYTEEEWPKIEKGIKKAVIDYAQKGHTESFGEWDRNVNTVSVPMKLADENIVSLSCGGPSYMLSPEKLREELGPRLIHVARDVMSSNI